MALQPLYIVILSNIFVSSILLGLYFYVDSQGAELRQIRQSISDLAHQGREVGGGSKVGQYSAPKTCPWKFKEYKSSPWEQLWRDNILNNNCLRATRVKEQQIIFIINVNILLTIHFCLDVYYILKSGKMPHAKDIQWTTTSLMPRNL